MNVADVRFLFAYDRWATRRVLNTAAAIAPEDWARPNAIGERGMGGILQHAYGAHLRWRVSWQGATMRPRPELDPLPTATELRALWDAEWTALDAYLDTSMTPRSPDRSTFFGSGRRWPTSSTTARSIGARSQGS